MYIGALDESNDLKIRTAPLWHVCFPSLESAAPKWDTGSETGFLSQCCTRVLGTDELWV